MKYIARIFKIVIAALFFLFQSAYGQETVEMPEEVLKTIQTRVKDGIYVGIVVGIIAPDGPHYYSFGSVSLSSDQAPDEYTVYEIGSITKVFTSILLADMAGKNEIDLNDPIMKYLPQEVRVPSHNDQHITFAHLATHTSGLPRLPDNMNPTNPSNPYADYSVEQMYDFLSNHTLRRAVGEKYEYSNYAVGLLGHTLALRNGTSYEKLFQQRIAKIIDLNDTGITLTSDMQRRLAKGFNGGVEVENWDIPTLAGAGALRSTIHDMVRFISANMGILKTPLYAAMQTTHETRITEGVGQGMHVGLGWHIRVSDNGETIWHNGGTGGYRSFAGFIRDGDTGVVVLTNSTESVDDIGFHLLDSSFALQKIKPSIAAILRKTIDEKGIEAGVQQYRSIKDKPSDAYNFREGELNNLGYLYLGKGEIETAIAIFKLNVEAYPDAANTYDSLGEAYMKHGNTDLAIVNYKKSLELNPGNDGARKKLADMGVDDAGLSKDVKVAPEILQTYVGEYQLAPSFIITVTKDGDKLFAQATGQSRFQIFPMSNTKFFYKVVDAQITFNLNEAGIIESLTLHQNGRNMPGKKVE